MSSKAPISKGEPDKASPIESGDKLRREIGGRLREFRKGLDLTQEQMAALTPESVATYRRFERGLSSPSAECINALMEHGLNPEWLLTGYRPLKSRPMRIETTAASPWISSCLNRINEDYKDNIHDLLSLLEISDTEWERMIKQNTYPNAYIISRLVELGYSADWLMTGEGERKRQDAPARLMADAHLLGRLTDGIVRLYKEMGQGIALHQAVEKAVELHDEIVSAIGPDDDGARAGAMALALSRLRTELRSAAANPVETKRLA